MRNNEWLKDLKVGDEVFVITSRYGTIATTLVKIDKITPTGQIVIGTSRFKNGELMGSSYLSRTYLEEATKDKIEEYNKIVYEQKVVKNLHELKSITYQQAKAIAEILGWEIIN